jgi:hypothetical protein
MDGTAPPRADDALDETVRALLRAMLESVDLDGGDELLEQVSRARVVARAGLDCLLSVDGDVALPSDPAPPAVIALVDASPVDREIYGEPYGGRLELHTVDGRLHALVYSAWFAQGELPDPSEVHPTTQVAGQRALEHDHFTRE